jgi:hypothetical protein
MSNETDRTDGPKKAYETPLLTKFGDIAAVTHGMRWTSSSDNIVCGDTVPLSSLGGNCDEPEEPD